MTTLYFSVKKHNSSAAGHSSPLPPFFDNNSIQPQVFSIGMSFLSFLPVSTKTDS